MITIPERENKIKKPTVGLGALGGTGLLAVGTGGAAAGTGVGASQEGTVGLFAGLGLGADGTGGPAEIGWLGP